MFKDNQKTICFIHYGIGWKDGINTVIKTLAVRIQEQKPSLKICFLAGEVKNRFLKNASYKVIPELRPSRSKLTKKNIQKKGLVIAKKISRATKGMEAVVIENPYLGAYHLPAMLGFSIYASQYKPKGTKVFFRVHDFYIDTPQYFRGLSKFFSPSEIKDIVKGKGVDAIFTVNQSLKKKLIKEGTPKRKIFYLPNGVDIKIFNKRISEKESELVYKSLKIPVKHRKKIKILLYPVRVVPRKNIEEAILLVDFIRELRDDNYILVISGKIDKNDPLSAAYYERLKELVKAVKFPVIFSKKPFPLEREYDAFGKIKRFSVGDLYKASSAVVMTSLREGFGYPFLECWFAEKFIIGRRIDNVIRDFEKSGLKFQWLYSCFLIQEKKSAILEDEESFERVNKIIHIFQDPKLKKQILKLNKTSIMKQIEILQDKKKQKKIIDTNFKKAREVYETSKITKRFLRLADLK